MVTYKILQIKDIANTAYAFRPYVQTLFNIEDYDLRFTGQAQDYPDLELCDAIYHFFNCGQPANFSGHSLSISDLIQLESEDEIRLYYCDLIGWIRLK